MNYYSPSLISQVYGGADKRYGPPSGPRSGQFAETHFDTSPVGGDVRLHAVPGAKVRSLYGPDPSIHVCFRFCLFCFFFLVLHICHPLVVYNYNCILCTFSSRTTLMC